MVRKCARWKNGAVENNALSFPDDHTSKLQCLAVLRHCYISHFMSKNTTRLTEFIPNIIESHKGLQLYTYTEDIQYIQRN